MRLRIFLAGGDSRLSNQDNRFGPNCPPFTNRVDIFAGLRLDADTMRVDFESVCEILPHFVDVWPQLWRFQADCRIYVRYDVAPFFKKTDRVPQKDRTFRITPSFVVAWKM